MDRLPPKDSAERLKVRVQRHSTQRLMRKPVTVSAGTVVSTEKCNGQLRVKLVSPVAEVVDS